MLSRQLLVGIALGAAVSFLGSYWLLGTAPMAEPARDRRPVPDRALAAQLSRLESRLISFEASTRASEATSASLTHDAPARVVEPEQTAAAQREPEPEPEQPSVGDEAAAEAGRTLLNTAFDRQRWDEESREQFRQLRSTMPPHEAFELSRRLAAAINARQISVETDGPPL